MHLSKILLTSRPILWFMGPLVYFSIIKMYAVSLTPVILFQALMLSFPFSFFLYGINDIYDSKTDVINQRRSVKLTKSDIYSIKKISFYMVSFLIFSSLLTMDVKNLVAMILLVFLSYYYSAPPLRFKELPLLDSLSNALIVYAVVMLVFSFTNELFSSKIIFGLIAVAGFHAFAAALDYDADRISKTKTIAVIFGKKITILFSIFCLSFAYFFSGIVSFWINYFLLLNLLLFIFCFLFPKYQYLRTTLLISCITFIFFITLFVIL